MLQTFRRKSDNLIVLQVKANIPAGQALQRDDGLRHSVHYTAGGGLVELSASATPILIDRQTELSIPVISVADLNLLFDLRDGLYGRPVRWQNEVGADMDVVIFRVESQAWPGGQRFQARVLLQPVL